MVWYMWASLGVFAIVFEVASPTFFAGFIGIGFLGAAVLSYFIPDSLIFQLLVVLAGMFAGAFIFKRRKMGDTPMSKIGQSDEFIGVQGLVVESLDAEHLGLVLLNTPFLEMQNGLPFHTMAQPLSKERELRLSLSMLNILVSNMLIKRSYNESKC